MYEKLIRFASSKIPVKQRGLMGSIDMYRDYLKYREDPEARKVLEDAEHGDLYAFTIEKLLEANGTKREFECILWAALLIAENFNSEQALIACEHAISIQKDWAYQASLEVFVHLLMGVHLCTALEIKKLTKTQEHWPKYLVLAAGRELKILQRSLIGNLSVREKLDFAVQEYSDETRFPWRDSNEDNLEKLKQAFQGIRLTTTRIQIQKSVIDPYVTNVRDSLQQEMDKTLHMIPILDKVPQIATMHALAFLFTHREYTSENLIETTINTVIMNPGELSRAIQVFVQSNHCS